MVSYARKADNGPDTRNKPRYIVDDVDPRSSSQKPSKLYYQPSQ